MFLKFILYLFLFYFVIRFLRGLFQTNVIIKNYHYHTNETEKEEGKVTITQGTEKKKKTGSSQQGDYVDYEEVK